MAQIKQSKKPEQNDHDELKKRFDGFLATAHAKGQPYRLIGDIRLKENRLYAQIAYPANYSANERDDWWEMVANQLTDVFLALVNPTLDQSGLTVTVALLEERWHAFALRYEIETESIELKRNNGEPVLYVQYDIGSIQAVFDSKEQADAKLADYQFILNHTFEPEGLIGKMELGIRKY